jgi:2-polyprenyl-6-methoxyphenol hydroxylase-like FAD-dependent oxidoreductase
MSTIRRFAIVGGGVAGLLTAHGLRRAGHDVTLFSDRTAEAWLRASRPTGSAARFAPALSYERELGLDRWHDEAPCIGGAHIVFCPKPNLRLATSTGRQKAPAYAIDMRLQCHDWMNRLEERGGRVVIENVTASRLDAIAEGHDLTIVASGKAELTNLFARDPERSVYDRPRRAVAMVIAKGPRLALEGVPFLGVKNNIVDGLGEAVWMPYFHRDVGPCWNFVFEAHPGGPMDLFGSVKTGDDALAAAKTIIERFVPWDAAWARGMELADPLGWLAGRITPTVRRPVATLPSGRVVTCVGDAAMHFDPLAAQGANNATKMSRHLVRSIEARGAQPFDAAWMTRTFDAFWDDEGRPAYALTNIMLEPMTPAGRLLLVAQYGSDGVRTDGPQKIADLFAEGFADPRLLVDALLDTREAKRLIAGATGRSWAAATARGALGIAAAQVRQRIAAARGALASSARP